MDTHLPYFDRFKIDQYYAGLDVITRARLPSTPLDLVRGLYRKMVLYADEKFGELIAELKRRGIYDQALVVVTGDHGESFGEHDQLAHSGVPYDQQTHVPLLVKFPQNRYGGTTNSEIVELVDLMPTIAEQFGIDVAHPPVHGKSLLRTLAQSDPPRTWAFSEYASIYSLRSRRYHYIKENRPPADARRFKRRIKRLLSLIFPRLVRYQIEELYDLDADPTASQNLIHSRGYQEIRREFQAELDRRLVEYNDLASTWGRITEAGIDEVLAKRLRSLGYLV